MSSSDSNRGRFHWMISGWADAYKDVMALVDAIHSKQKPSINPAIMILSIAVLWFIYVPIHELLHVAGCVGTGGSVQELIMGKEYGADLLDDIFPFIVPQSSKYAGRLTGFEPANDLSYLVTDLAPFVLVLPGVFIFRQGLKRLRSIQTGVGLLLALSPFMNLTGDFFEMGTIITTRLGFWITGGRAPEWINKFWDLRSDDIFRLLGEISEAPSAYGIGNPVNTLLTGTVILSGLIIGLLLAGWVYRSGDYFSNFLEKGKPDKNTHQASVNQYQKEIKHENSHRDR